MIELGTNVGISSAYIGAALKVNGDGGKIVTCDASSYRQRLAREMHRKLGIDNVSYVEGLFTDTLGDTLIKMGTVDLASIDGHHQYQPTLDYFDKLYGFSTGDAVIVFDDIRWSDGMIKVWSQLQADDRLGLLVDVVSMGIGVHRRAAITERYILPSFEVP